MANIYTKLPPAHNHDQVYAKIGEGGVTDHGLLTGLEDNDHPQYLLTTGKAADSDKLDGIDSTGFVQTSGNQTVAGIKTFSSIPVLPSTNPTTANQAVRKGYADATYLGITAKAADSDKLGGVAATSYPTFTAWTNYTPSSQTGWTAMPTGTYRYCQIGKMVFCLIAIAAGTSNATTAEIALPVTGATTNPLNRGTWGWAMDNGVQVNPAGGYVLSKTLIKFFKTSIDNAAWTNSGTKRIYCAFFYEAA